MLVFVKLELYVVVIYYIGFLNRFFERLVNVFNGWVIVVCLVIVR